MEAAAESIEDLSGHITDKLCAMKHHRTRSTISDRLCYRCGGPHTDSRCKFKDSKCYKICQKIGHIAKVCRSTHTAKVQPKNKHKADMLDENNVTEQSCVLYSMYSTSAPLCRNLFINGTAVKFQIDTGASLSVMNKKTFVDVRGGWGHPLLDNNNLLYRHHRRDCTVKQRAIHTLTRTYTY